MTSPKRASIPRELATVEDFGDFDEDSDDIKFSTSDKTSAYPRVKAATVEKLIFRLTHEKYPGTVWSTLLNDAIWLPPLIRSITRH